MSARVYKKICALLWIGSLFSGSLVWAETNLIKNPGFEDESGGYPAAWSTIIWEDTPEAVEISWDTDGAFEGERCLRLVNKRPNDTRIIQTVQVKPESSYKVSCMARVHETGTITAGANISEIGQLSIPTDIRGTTEDWQLLETYIRTGKGIKSITLCLCLGGYSNLNIGTAVFDNVSMIEATIPDGVEAIDVRAQQEQKPEGEEGPATTPEGERKSGIENLLLILFFAILTIVVLLFLIFNKPRPRPESDSQKGISQGDSQTQSPPLPTGETKKEEADIKGKEK